MVRANLMDTWMMWLFYKIYILCSFTFRKLANLVSGVYLFKKTKKTNLSVHSKKTSTLWTHW